MIEIDDVTVQFGGVLGLNALTANLAEPVTGLVGPNGAGKTTLINVLSGFVRPTKGRVRVDGRDLKDIPIRKRAAFGLRRTFQNEQIVENLTAGDNVAAVLDNVSTDGQPRRLLIDKALDFVGLLAKRNTPGHDLNAYQRRMLEIARATAGLPRLIMMDEPGAGLAQHESEHLRDVIKAIHGHCGAQVLLVDHDVDLISATCTATLVLDFGSAIACGPTAEVLANPRVRAAYLGVLEQAT
ncbi:ABC transporter ATP-binding protein [Bradyrhizobium tropiciagri]|uniref:ABC transporter ATP-binding protein n=1 Tax=Bradyrhizobium tropiciagri TaxID=312253 RepID=UPI001BAC37A3|nr:ATP-binding cassette domain-containing protein [Bradyrhizobium tropiciagri]MBR0895914.1 ABC transporter ATP-binding protein [Bradyrhizobium tropiciagri]